MNTWVLINDKVFPVDTTEEIKEAQAEMHAAGIGAVDVYVGDPDSPDAQKNGQRLFASAEFGLSK